MYQYPNGNVFYRKLDGDLPICVKGEGIYLYDQEGKKYIDGTGGPLCVTIGHGISEIAEAAEAQAKQIAYVHGSQFTTLAIEEFTKKLAKVLPSGIDKIYPVGSGSEANETALKLARQYQLSLGNSQRYKVIGRWFSYHGSTLGSLSMMGKVSFRKPYLPLLLDFPHIPAPYCYRCPFEKTYPQCKILCARFLEKMIELEGPETISAFIAEPIIGSTLGAVVPPKEYYRIIREICDKYNILFIADEVMSGYGRTGKWFALDHWGVVPDIVTMGKGISSGYVPLAAMAVKKEIVDVIKEKGDNFVHGYTFSHHPVSSAVGLAVLNYMEKHDLVEKSAARGKYLYEKLEELKEKFFFIGDVRGKGLMIGIEFVKDKDSKVPFPRKILFKEKIQKKSFEKGLYIYSTTTGMVDGINGDGIIIAPPYIIQEQEIDKIVDILKEVFLEIEKGLQTTLPGKVID
ncbi:MAG: Uncharacterized protein XD85_0038 [Parcubacteria bacterium 34_609]|nr:MAG: Uncharacterized protein XD85_0038 [Parcubacteria bacterium 34_609]